VQFNNTKELNDSDHPLTALPREDLDLIAELVLRSGSLKDLATAYDVSYPTIRVRLDRVIERLRGLIARKPRDPLAELLAGFVERGELSIANARAVRRTVQDLLGAARSDQKIDADSAPSKGESS